MTNGKATVRDRLPGDWRSGAYGANRRAHLFVFAFSYKKHPACGVRDTGKYRRRVTAPADACYDCLAYGASGRAS